MNEVAQQGYPMDGKFQESWNEMAERFEMVKTSFMDEELTKPDSLVLSSLYEQHIQFGRDFDEIVTSVLESLKNNGNAWDSLSCVRVKLDLLKVDSNNATREIDKIFSLVKIQLASLNSGIKAIERERKKNVPLPVLASLALSYMHQFTLPNSDMRDALDKLVYSQNMTIILNKLTKEVQRTKTK